MPAGNWPGDRWWIDIGDPQLTGLIDEALANSPDLVVADARLRSAEGFARAAGASLLPAVSANADADVQRQSLNNGIPPQFVPPGWQDTGRATLNLSYELDFFGRHRAQLRAATSQVEAARIEAQAARLVLATSVAAAYADFLRIHGDLEVAETALRIRTETADLVARRVANGLDTRAEQRQADAGVESARGDLEALIEARDLTRNAIAALVGAGPDRGRSIVPPGNSAYRTYGLPNELALGLVARRPDLVAARLRAEAAAARIDVARAEFYPNVNLTAFIGFQSLGLENLFKDGSSIGLAGPAISLPLFQGGRLSGNFTRARGEYDEAVALYELTLLRAVREVADAATSQRALASRLSRAQAAVDASEEAYAIARQRYDGGLAGFLTVLAAEDALLANKRLLRTLETRTLAIEVELIRALGGGFGASTDNS